MCGDRVCATPVIRQPRLGRVHGGTCSVVAGGALLFLSVFRKLEVRTTQWQWKNNSGATKHTFASRKVTESYKAVFMCPKIVLVLVLVIQTASANTRLGNTRWCGEVVGKQLCTAGKGKT